LRLAGRARDRYDAAAIHPSGWNRSFTVQETRMTAYKHRLNRKRAKLKQAKMKAKARARKKVGTKKR
jgi:hypothetical protein